MLKENPDHFGHDSTHPPHPNIIKKWASVRNLDDLFAKFGAKDGEKKTIDLAGNGYDKLLGGGKTSNAYVIKVGQLTASAEEKIKQAGGQVLTKDG